MRAWPIDAQADGIRFLFLIYRILRPDNLMPVTAVVRYAIRFAWRTTSTPPR